MREIGEVLARVEEGVGAGAREVVEGRYGAKTTGFISRALLEVTRKCNFRTVLSLTCPNRQGRGRSCS